jgi:cell division septal protein FtsQ
MKDKKASPKNKKQVLRQQRQEKGRRQKYLRISIFVIGLALVAGYMLWPRPKAQAVSYHGSITESCRSSPVCL